MKTHFFAHPEPVHRTRIRPFFLPFAGCPDKCVFCDQHLQTATAPKKISAYIKDLQQQLQQDANRGADPMELAFYGGTFTRLPERHLVRFLEIAVHYRERGLVTKIRCSTRPDAVSPELLAFLRDLGLDMVELGIQSFDDNTLEQSRRGYTGSIAREGCDIVRQSGLELGVQLLPALPGSTPSVFLRDIEATLAVAPTTVRIYPCQVIAGTPLGALYENGSYKPWPLQQTMETVALALVRLWSRRINVIRIGLAPEPAMAPYIIAGASHPALGARVRALALHHIVRTHAAALGHPSAHLDIPRRYQGEFWGHRNELVPLYRRMGFTHDNVHIWNLPLFRIQ